MYILCPAPFVRHRTDDGGDGIVTLILERAVNASTPLAPRLSGARLEPLGAILAKDLRLPTAAAGGLGAELDALSPAARARALLDDRRPDP